MNNLKRHFKHGACCPNCGHEDWIEGGSVTIEGIKAFQECSCGKCNQEWTDIYTLDCVKTGEDFHGIDD